MLATPKPTTTTMPYRIPSSSPTWTITSLIGSYLDLTLAYLFLVGATLFFMASKLLSFFSLPFPSPSPSSGLFGDPNRIHAVLLDCTRTRIESIHSSIRSRFPFDVIFNDPSSSVGFGPDPVPVPGPAEDHVLRLTGPEAVEDANWAIAPLKGRRIRRRKGKGMRVSWQKEGFGDNFEAESVREESSVGQILVGRCKDAILLKF